MEKVTDFNNCWCEANGETIKALNLKTKELKCQRISTNNLKTSLMQFLSYYKIMTENRTTIMRIDARHSKPLSGRQIELIDGEFYYSDSINPLEMSEQKFEVHTDKVFNTDFVKPYNCKSAITKISKDECQFARYGFEKPSFECNILKAIEEKLAHKPKELVFIGYYTSKDNGITYPCKWNKLGECIFSSSAKTHKYNLTPLKKEWYEDVNSFGKLCIRTYNEYSIQKNIEEKFIYAAKIENKLFGLSFTGDEISVLAKDCRLATKEEVLSLYKES